jgi:hypothetical protein
MCNQPLEKSNGRNESKSGGKKKSSRAYQVNTALKKNTHSLGTSKPREHGGHRQLGVPLL